MNGRPVGFKEIQCTAGAVFRYYFGLNVPRPGSFGVVKPSLTVLGCERWSDLQSDGECFLCPKCGGYGGISPKGSNLLNAVICDVCGGLGKIPLNHPGIYRRNAVLLLPSPVNLPELSAAE